MPLQTPSHNPTLHTSPPTNRTGKCHTLRQNSVLAVFIEEPFSFQNRQAAPSIHALTPVLMIRNGHSTTPVRYKPPHIGNIRMLYLSEMRAFMAGLTQHSIRYPAYLYSWAIVV